MDIHLGQHDSIQFHANEVSDIVIVKTDLLVSVMAKAINVMAFSIQPYSIILQFYDSKDAVIFQCHERELVDFLKVKNGSDFKELLSFKNVMQSITLPHRFFSAINHDQEYSKINSDFIKSVEFFLNFGIIVVNPSCSLLDDFV
jgi:hypothetical protein